MKTAPSFQFYPADFVSGTLTMDAAEVGAYIRLLCYQWNQGSCPTEPDDIARITGMPHAKLARRVLPKFTINGDSMHNERLERTREEVESYRAKQANNGKKGGRPPKATTTKTETQNNPPVFRGFVLENPSESSQTQSLTQSHSQNIPPNPQGGEKEKVKVESGWFPTEEQRIVNSWFGRRDTTPWSEKELRVWKALGIATITEGIAALQNYYSQPNATYKRKDMQTLLNNWRGEMDRWRNFNPPVRSDVQIHQQGCNPDQLI